MKKILKLMPVPEEISVYATYEDAGKTFYTKCEFIAVCDDGFAHLYELSGDGEFDDPEDTCNFRGFVVLRENDHSWLDSDEFNKLTEGDSDGT